MQWRIFIVEFALFCATSSPAFNQAIKTCNMKVKPGDTDSMFLIKEQDGSLWVTSLNDKAQQTVLIPTTRLIAEKNESFFVSGHSIVEFFKQFPDDEAICKYDGSTLSIKGMVKDLEFKFATTDTDNFSPINYVSTSNEIAVSGMDLANALHMTAFSALNTTAISPYVAVSVKIAGDHLVAQSTDDQRISISEIEIEDIGMESIDFLLPKETAEILSTLLTDEPEVFIEKGRRTIKLRWEDTIFISSLVCDLDEEYPDLEELFSGDTVASVNISRGEVLRSLKLAGLIAKDSYITLEVTEDGLRIITDEKGKGSGKNLVLAQTATGKARTMIPYKNFLKGIDIIDAAWVDLEFKEMICGDVYGLCIVCDSYKHFIFPSAANDNDNIEDTHGEEES